MVVQVFVSCRLSSGRAGQAVQTPPAAVYNATNFFAVNRLFMQQRLYVHTHHSTFIIRPTGGGEKWEN